jgi:hypothetical protein
MRRPGIWRMSSVVPVVLLLGMALGMATSRVTAGQQPTTLTFTVTENRVPGAAGSGTITPLGGNQLRIDIRLTGMPANGEHAMHIHLADGARCDTNAPIVYPLTNVRVDGAGVGTSTSTVTLRPEQPVRAGNAYINVHQGATVPSPGVICANIDTTFAADGAAGAGTGAMPNATPRTGTGLVADSALTSWAIGALVALAVLLGGIGTLVALRRR